MKINFCLRGVNIYSQYTFECTKAFIYIGAYDVDADIRINLQTTIAFSSVNGPHLGWERYILKKL